MACLNYHFTIACHNWSLYKKKMNLKEVRLDKKIERKKSKAWTLSINIAVGFVNVQELQVLKPVTK